MSCSGPSSPKTALAESATRPKHRRCAANLPPATRPRRINFEYPTVLGAVHLVACLAFLPWFFSWTGIVTMIVGATVVQLLGINVGYHRLLTHRSFTCPKWLEYTLASIGLCSLQESPAYWVAVHRLHHRDADEPDDPHSPRAGLWWAHAGWLCRMNREFDTREKFHSYARDLMRQPFYQWIDGRVNRTLFMSIVLAAHFAFGFLVGWLKAGSANTGLQVACSVLVWGFFLRVVVGLHTTWAVNSFGHRWGYRNFDTPDDSRNNFFLGVFVHGDGWHNNHHAHPRLASHGHKWWEVDTAYWVICLFEKVGLARSVVRPQAASESDAQ